MLDYKQGIRIGSRAETGPNINDRFSRTEFPKWWQEGTSENILHLRKYSAPQKIFCTSENSLYLRK